MTVTMAAAISTPTVTANMLFLKSMWKRSAASEPVQAPVPGRGIPTKTISLVFGAFLKPLDDFFKVLGFFEKIKYSSDEFKHEGNGKKISHDTNGDGHIPLHSEQRRHDYAAAKLDNRQHGNYENNDLVGKPEPLKKLRQCFCHKICSFTVYTVNFIKSLSNRLSQYGKV